MRSRSPCEAAKDAKHRRQSISFADATKFLQQSPISARLRRSPRKHKGSFKGEEELLTHSWDASLGYVSYVPKSKVADIENGDPCDQSMEDINTGDPNDLKVPITLEPFPLSANHGSFTCSSAVEGQASRSTPLPPGDDPSSTKISKTTFNPENFEENIQAIRKAKPFWFSPFRSSTLPPSYESPSTGVSNRTLNPEQFQKHLKDIQRDTNTFYDLEALGMQDQDLGMKEWDYVGDEGFSPATPTFKMRRTNSLVFGTPAFDEFKDLRYSPSTHESVDKTLHRTQEIDQLSFEEIFQIHQETQPQPSPSPKRKRETLAHHKRSTYFKCSREQNPLCIFRNEKSAFMAQYQQLNPLGTTALQQVTSYDQEYHHHESPCSSLPSPPPKRRKVDLEGKENITPLIDGENKTKPVWSKGKTGATKRRFLREKKMQQKGSFSCPPIQRTGCFQKDDKCENFFMYEGSRMMFNSPGKSSLKAHSYEHNSVRLSEPVNPFNAEVLSYCPPPNSPANLAHNKENNISPCHPDSPLEPFYDNPLGSTYSPYTNFSPLSTAQLRALYPTTIIVNIVRKMSTQNQPAKGTGNATEGERREVQDQLQTINQINPSCEHRTIHDHPFEVLLREAAADYPHGIPPDILQAAMTAIENQDPPGPLLHQRGPLPISIDMNRPAPAAAPAVITGLIPAYAPSVNNLSFGRRPQQATQHQRPQVAGPATHTAPAQCGLRPQLGCDHCKAIRNTPKKFREIGVMVKCRLCDRVIGDGEEESTFADNEHGYFDGEVDDDYAGWMAEWVLEVVEPLKRVIEEVKLGEGERALFDF